jgi:hypothetical protein
VAAATKKCRGAYPLHVPTVCRYKPNRTNPRNFGSSDAVRVLCAVLNSPEALDQEASDDQSIGSTIAIGPPEVFERRLASIVARVRTRCSPGKPARPQINVELSAIAAIQALELAEREAEANSVTFSNLLDIFNAVSGLLVALLAITKVPVLGPLLRRFPVTNVVILGATRVLSRVEGFVGTILARKAANDTSWAVIRGTIEALKKAA